VPKARGAYRVLSDSMEGLGAKGVLWPRRTRPPIFFSWLPPRASWEDLSEQSWRLGAEFLFFFFNEEIWREQPGTRGCKGKKNAVSRGGSARWHQLPARCTDQ